MKSLPEQAGKLVVMDGLFSMEGDLADLPHLVPIAKQYGARIMVDDAHGMGVLGKGRGTVAHWGMTDQVDLIMSTFSKSFASLGGFIAGQRDVVDYIKHHARALIFSASITAANAASALASLQVMREEPERIERVNEIGRRMRAGYQSLGFDIGKSETPVVPIIIGDDLASKILSSEAAQSSQEGRAESASGAGSGHPVTGAVTHSDSNCSDNIIFHFET